MSQDLWKDLLDLRKVTDLTGELHPLQQQQLLYWPLLAFESGKSVGVTWGIGERKPFNPPQDLHQSFRLIEQHLRVLPGTSASWPWKVRPRVQFDLVLEGEEPDPAHLPEKVAAVVEAVRRMLGDAVVVVFRGWSSPEHRASGVSPDFEIVEE